MTIDLAHPAVSLEMLSRLLDQVTSALMAVDAAGRIIVMNADAQAALRVPVEECIGSRLDDDVGANPRVPIHGSGAPGVSRLPPRSSPPNGHRGPAMRPAQSGMRQGPARLLDLEPDITIMSQVASGREVDGVEATAVISQHYPDVKVIARAIRVVAAGGSIVSPSERQRLNLSDREIEILRQQATPKSPP